jgi:hypothetical protein
MEISRNRSASAASTTMTRNDNDLLSGIGDGAALEEPQLLLYSSGGFTGAY